MPDVIGAIRDKWLATGGAAGVLGDPVAAEAATFDGVGRATGAVILLFWCVFAAQTNDVWLHSDFGQPKSLRGL